MRIGEGVSISQEIYPLHRKIEGVFSLKKANQ